MNQTTSPYRVSLYLLLRHCEAVKTQYVMPLLRCCSGHEGGEDVFGKQKYCLHYPSMVLHIQGRIREVIASWYLIVKDHLITCWLPVHLCTVWRRTDPISVFLELIKGFSSTQHFCYPFETTKKAPKRVPVSVSN